MSYRNFVKYMSALLCFASVAVTIALVPEGSVLTSLPDKLVFLAAFIITAIVAAGITGLTFHVIHWMFRVLVPIFPYEEKEQYSWSYFLWQIVYCEIGTLTAALIIAGVRHIY